MSPTERWTVSWPMLLFLMHETIWCSGSTLSLTGKGTSSILVVVVWSSIAVNLMAVMGLQFFLKLINPLGFPVDPCNPKAFVFGVSF